MKTYQRKCKGEDGRDGESYITYGNGEMEERGNKGVDPKQIGSLWRLSAEKDRGYHGRKEEILLCCEVINNEAEEKNNC